MSVFVPVNAAAIPTSGGGSGTLADQMPTMLGDGVDTSTSVRTDLTVTASATPHTPGSWTQVFASTSAAASGLMIRLTVSSFTASTNTSTLLEIGTGASGSEVVWATIGVGYYGSNAVWQVPGLIAAGTRVSVRVRSVVASKAISINVSAISVKATASPIAPVTMGVDTATSHGTPLATPGSINTKGAWTQITASTASAISLLLVSLQGNDRASMAAGGVLVDIGIGASGSESVLIADLYVNGNASELYEQRSLTTRGVSVASGTRLSARYQASSAANQIDVILVGA